MKDDEEDAKIKIPGSKLTELHHRQVDELLASKSIFFRGTTNLHTLTLTYSFVPDNVRKATL
jgi:hypothetical protein